MKFNSKGSTVLEVLPKNVCEKSLVMLKCKSSTQMRSAYCALVSFSLKQNTDYELVYENCQESFAYTYEPKDVIEKGINILALHKGKSPYKETMHFTPPIGWLNDPNGLCYSGGVYHMYYQFYPHAQVWGNMHWGHAVSKDLVHWWHMPVFLTPQQALIENSALAGGAFSGSAVCENGKMRFFLTRHSAEKADESTMQEEQTTLTSQNGIKPESEEVIIQNNNTLFSFHFRDPKVFTHNGINYMVIGSAVNNKAGLLLYTSKNYTNWEYKGCVLEISDSDCVTVECPDMFELNGKFVCVAAKMCVLDVCGRKSPVYWYVGDFNGESFTEQANGLYDFGANFYAVQSFEHRGRRIAIGWINDFYAEHREAPGGVCGSMSLPRELFIKNNVLYQRPVKEVYNCLGEKLYEGQGESTKLKLSTNCWYAEIIANETAVFNITAAREGKDTLCFVNEKGQSYIQTTRAGGLKLIAPVGALNRLEIFADGRCFEFFVNGGEAAGAKTFYCNDSCGVFELNSVCGVESVKLFSLKL